MMLNKHWGMAGSIMFYISKLFDNSLPNIRIMMTKLLNKIIIMSKYALLGMVLQVLLFSVITAREVEGQNSIKNVFLNIDLNGSKIQEAFNKIENATEFTFSYKRNAIGNKRIQGFNSGETSLADLLLEIGKATNLKFRRVNETIHVSRSTDDNVKVLEYDGTLADVDISGKVTDENGEGLPGASVIEKGTTNGTTTDLNGLYKLNLPENATIVVSFVGYRTMEIPLAGQSTIDIRMELDAEQLEEVVVVGYGTQKKSHVTGSLATVKSQDLTSTPVTNVTQNLAGRLPGLVVTNNSGEPGNDVAAISIRGFGRSLVIVDGIPRDFQQLDPNEIESITILKDAAAAIYGAQAGNGVVLVTTKRGKRNTAPQVNYSGSYNLQSPTYLPPTASAGSVAEFLYNMETAEGINDSELTFSAEDVQKFKQGTEVGFRGTDWQKHLLKDRATSYQHNINASGGTEDVNYFLNMGKLDQNSLLRSGAGKFERYNFGLTVDANITKRIKVGLDMKYRIEDRDNPTGNDGGYEGFFRFLLLADPTIEVNPEGLLTATGRNSLQQNPAAYSDQSIAGFERDKRKQFNLIFNTEYDLPVEGLKAKGRVAYQSWNRSNRSALFSWDQYKYNYNLQQSELITGSRDNEVSTFTVESNNITTQFSLDYTKQFGDHGISAMILGESRFQDSYRIDVTSTDILTTSLPYLFITKNSGAASVGDSPSESGRKSWLGRINYNYKEKYLFEGLFRADAAIEFAPSNPWGNFFGLSAGWVISNEPFLDSFDQLDFLKLRLSHGELGDDRTVSQNATARFDFLTGYTLTNNSRWVFGGDVLSSTYTTLGDPNPNITWTTMRTTNIGFESMFFGGKLGVEFDYFYRYQDGLLAQGTEQLPTTYGGNLPLQNIEDRDNRGFELVLSHENSIGDLNFNISGNVTWSREKWVDYPDGEFDETNPDDERINKRTGQWTNRIFGYKSDGLYQSQDEIDNDGIEYDGNIPEPVIGDIRYVDFNGDGFINENDRTVIGRGISQINGLPPIPEFMFGFAFDANYKGFDLSMLWQGAANIDYLASGFEKGVNMSIGHIPFQYMVDNTWSPEHTNRPLPPQESTTGLNSHNDKPVDIYLRDGSYLRLKAISLGYNLPNSILEPVGIRKVRLFVAGYNLLTLTANDLFAFDPESRAGNSFAIYPVQKTISFGVNVGF